MPAHVRIRILLVIAVVVICGGVGFVTQLQRHSDEASFVEYSAVRELHAATLQMIIALDDAVSRGAGAAREVRRAERTVLRAIADVRAHPEGQTATERRLVDEQAAAAAGLADLASRAVTSAPPERLDARRDALAGRFLASSDRLHAILRASAASCAATPRAARSSSSSRCSCFSASFTSSSSSAPPAASAARGAPSASSARPCRSRARRPRPTTCSQATSTA